MYGNQGHETFGATTHVVYVRQGYTYGNEPSLAYRTERFSRLVETPLERKRRIFYEQRRVAMFRMRRFGLLPMAESMISKPTFVRRACGGRWRVRTP